MLVDFAAFPAWNPFITQAEDRLEVGGRLTLRMQPVGGSAVTLRPTLVEVVHPQQLRWQGRLGVPGLFDADHLFTVEPLGAAASRLVQQQHFSGLLVPFLGVAGPWHAAGVSGDECGAEGPGGEGDGCAWPTLWPDPP